MVMSGLIRRGEPKPDKQDCKSCLIPNSDAERVNNETSLPTFRQAPCSLLLVSSWGPSVFALFSGLRDKNILFTSVL